MKTIQEDHPFTSRLEPDESFLWPGRPDKTAFMRRQWQGFRVGVAIGFIVAIASIFGIIDPSDPFQHAFCVFMLIVLPLILWMGLYFTRNAYKYAPWYALTARDLFAATPDDSGFVTHKTGLDNIKEVSGDKKPNAEVGTVHCRCYYSVVSLMSKNIRLEGIERPESVKELISEAKRYASAEV